MLFILQKGSDEMAERMYFFDSTEDDERIYQAADFARFHAQIIGNGVSNTKDLPDLEVTAKNNMDVGLGAGYMFANGYMYELTETMNLKHDVADPNNDRIDRVVIRFDNNPEKREIKAVIKKGTPAHSPVPPTLTRDNYIYEMSVAQVRIIAGKSHIEQYQITDERENDAVCGYIPLHNIYRGLNINEHGMVTMPNQSYVQMHDSSTLELAGDSTTSYVHNPILISPDIDRQKEVSNGSFYAKEDGVYMFHFHLALDVGLGDRQKIQASLRINDVAGVDDSLFFFSQPGTGYSDYHFTGSVILYLEKGDKATYIASTRSTGKIPSRYRRLTISKIS